jgi:hypothetical protein
MLRAIRYLQLRQSAQDIGNTLPCDIGNTFKVLRWLPGGGRDVRLDPVP